MVEGDAPALLLQHLTHDEDEKPPTTGAGLWPKNRCFPFIGQMVNRWYGSATSTEDRFTIRSSRTCNKCIISNNNYTTQTLLLKKQKKKYIQKTFSTVKIWRVSVVSLKYYGICAQFGTANRNVHWANHFPLQTARWGFLAYWLRGTRRQSCIECLHNFYIHKYQLSLEKNISFNHCGLACFPYSDSVSHYHRRPHLLLQDPRSLLVWNHLRAQSVSEGKTAPRYTNTDPAPN